MGPKWYTFLGKCIYYSVGGRKLTELKKDKKSFKSSLLPTEDGL